VTTASVGSQPIGRRHGWITAAALGLLLGAIPAATTQEPRAGDDIARENAIIVATLVRTTLVALHQANVTGNYTVLRDLAAPGFRDRNSAADLAAIFAPIRREEIDIGSVVVIEPKLTAPPFVDENQMLRIEGTLQTQPTAISFQLLYQVGEGGWRLFGISILPLRPLADADAASAEADDSSAQLSGPPILPGSLIPPTPRPRPRAEGEAQ
jgi:hypothetical protein